MKEWKDVPHAAVDGMHDEPAHSARYFHLRKRVTNMPLRFDHAVDEDSKDCGKHDKTLKPKELLQLIRSEEAEEKVNSPK